MTPFIPNKPFPVMKTITLALFLSVLLFAGCSPDDIPNCENCDFTCLAENEADVITNDCLPNWDCEFNIIPDAQLDLNEVEGVAAGNGFIFQMINSTLGSPQIADDEYTDILVCEIPGSQTSFSVEDAQLADLQVYFKRICFCPEVEFKAVTLGCLQGEELSPGNWRIQGKLEVPYTWGELEVKVDATFSL
jgi:hypothetical protein